MTPQPGGQDDYIKRPFADAEYRDRARRVREEMRRRGVDVLLVLSPPNQCYLTGFESIWYPPRAPVGAILAANDERLVFVDYDRHRTLVERVALYDDAVFYDYSTAVADLRSAVRARGWQDATIGVERWTQSPGAPLVDEIVAALAGEGANVVAGDWIVDRVRLVKSVAEQECVRRAGQIVDAAFASLAEFVRPGRTELEIAAHVNAVMAANGGEESGDPHHGVGRARRVVPHPLTAVAAPGRGRRRHVRGRVRGREPLPRRPVPHVRDRPRSS